MKNRIVGVLALIVLFSGLAQAGSPGRQVLTDGDPQIVLEPPPPPPPAMKMACGSSGC
jgi:hypothetical protein